MVNFIPQILLHSLLAHQTFFLVHLVNLAYQESNLQLLAPRNSIAAPQSFVKFQNSSTGYFCHQNSQLLLKFYLEPLDLVHYFPF